MGFVLSSGEDSCEPVHPRIIHNPTSHNPTLYSIFLTAEAKQAFIQCVFAACEREGNVDSMTPSKKYARRAE